MFGDVGDSDQDQSLTLRRYSITDREKRDATGTLTELALPRLIWLRKVSAISSALCFLSHSKLWIILTEKCALNLKLF